MTRTSHDAFNSALRRAAGRTVHGQDAEPVWDHDNPEGSRRRRVAWLGLDAHRTGSADGGGGHDYRPREDMNALIRRMAGR